MLFTLTIKDISLDLTPSVTKFVKRIISLVSQGTILNRRNNINKHIILQQHKHTKQD